MQIDRFRPEDVQIRRDLTGKFIAHHISLDVMETGSTWIDALENLRSALIHRVRWMVDQVIFNSDHR